MVWEQVVEQGQTAEADCWLRRQGGELLRGILGAAWTARSERWGVSGACECGGGLRFRQHQPWQVHTVWPGRDVPVVVQYGQCERCHRGRVPLWAEMRVDEKGFTEGLQELALLAGVLEPYHVGQEELLGRFAGVSGERGEDRAVGGPGRATGGAEAAGVTRAGAGGGRGGREGAVLRGDRRGDDLRRGALAGGQAGVHLPRSGPGRAERHPHRTDRPASGGGPWRTGGAGRAAVAAGAGGRHRRAPAGGGAGRWGTVDLESGGRAVPPPGGDPGLVPRPGARERDRAHPHTARGRNAARSGARSNGIACGTIGWRK